MTRTPSSKPWIAGGALLAVVLALVAWFMFISPQLDDQAATEQQTSDTELQNTVLQGRIAKLRADSEHLGDLQKQIEVEREGLPADHRMDDFTDQLTGQAAEAGVTLTSITPATPTLVSNVAPAAPTTAAAPTDGSSPTTSAESAAPETGGAPAAPAPTSAAGPAGQIYSIAVTVVGSGTMTANRALLSKIEKQGPRRALVTSASFAPVVDQTGVPGGAPGAPGTPGTTGARAAVTTTAAQPPATDRTWTMTVQLQVFVAPQSSAEASAMASEVSSNG
jgi:TolA-binding protein